VAIEFGLSLQFGSPKGAPASKWSDDLEASLPKLAGHFKSLWMTDHLQWVDDPTYEAWTVMSYLLARWPQFDVGPMVLSQSYRNPALLAKMAATLQNLSGGRYIMGIGAGWKEDEYHAYNYPFPRPGVRMEQLIDTLEIFKRLWTEPGKVTYHGKHYQVVDAYCEPKPNPVPPIVVGGGGERTMLIAARYADWWNLSDANITRYTDRVNVLKGHCDKIGRDWSTMRLTWFGRLSVGKTEAEALERGRRLFPGETEDEARKRGRDVYTRVNAFVGTPRQIVEDMQQFVALGVDYFMVDVIGLPDPGVIDTLLEDIVPKVKAAPLPANRR
jgi:alkanesulfonate monooxygenase SsuD/methylene tetrahydromethanopterin reductase-like flavin-dependent oxidoreductase (luciferase family)